MKSFICFYTTQHGKYYHIQPKCGKGSVFKRNPKAIYRSGKQPCTKCVKENDLSVDMKHSNRNLKRWKGYHTIDRERKKMENVIRYRSTRQYRWSVLKTCAKKRGLSLCLEQDDVLKMMKEPCFYCERIGDNISHSLDRLDNEREYTANNVVTCCSQCNHMKWTWNVLDFIQACINITDKTNATYENFDPKKDYIASSFKKYHTCAYRKNLSFKITEDEFRYVRYLCCTYCGRKASHEYPMGMDRKDNDQGYHIDNIVPCCPRCNRMKSNYREDFFRDICRRVSERWGSILKQYCTLSDLQKYMLSISNKTI